MMHWLALLTAFVLAIQPCLAFAEQPPISGPDTRLYLADGSLVEGQLIEKTDDLIIIRVKNQIFTFERLEVDKIVTVDSLGGGAQTISVTEFPYISFLGGTVAFGLLSWLQFDRASDKDSEAKRNEEFAKQSSTAAALLATAQKQRDDADRARIYGWSATVLAVGSLGVALMPRKTTRRIFPELTFKEGEPTLRLSYVHRF